MWSYITKHKVQILLAFFIFAYICYFSVLTVVRYRVLDAHYYDLGIMHQTVYNTYVGLRDGDFSRILELTNPETPDQIKRMSIHNDPILALIAPLYFIYASPETLVILQTVVLGLGALAVYKIARIILKKYRYSAWLSLILSVSYLLYTPMERANVFDFHGVTLATAFLLWMYYFWLVKKNKLSFLFLVLSLLCKEEVGLATTLFGLYAAFISFKEKRSYIFPAIVTVLSLGWFIVSLEYIIPHFRGGNHFALHYYGDFGDSPGKVILGVFENPMSIGKFLFRGDTLNYLWFTMGPLGFLSLLSPLHLIMAGPEYAINLLSQNWNMRNIIYHYTSVIQPFVFISAIYGIPVFFRLTKKYNQQLVQRILMIVLVVLSLGFAFTKSPLPLSRESDIYPFLYPQQGIPQVLYWANQLQSDSIKVSSTGHIAPFFTSRRYFYNFNAYYDRADYIVIKKDEVYNGGDKDKLSPLFEKLLKDPRYEQIYNQNDILVFRKKT